ncbi:uncharacterized protein B0P05DRAFT_550601 [Gilbertella persicaria]|uniref:uncharacterized protein n=1 Tax=Gilbertella persicaria TaxID=101096 RepID=UPI00221E5154|nr:uncharacterized protein B0P05DRAFT_550601 [Gilbertella persicaria]KAI8070661.1 hypothetical protein B0P05DRAFT_550601 [Gilbertella persicaria]
MEIPTKRHTLDPHTLPSKYESPSRYQQTPLQERNNYRSVIPTFPADHGDLGRRRTLQASEMLRLAEEEKQNQAVQQSIPKENTLMNEKAFELQQYKEEAAYWKGRTEKLERQNMQLQKHVEEMQHARYTDPEAELKNYIEWAEAKDQAFVNLKSQVEQSIQQGERSGIVLRQSTFGAPTHTRKYQKTRAEDQRHPDIGKEIAKIPHRVDYNQILGEHTEKPIISLYEDLTTVVIRGCKETEESHIYNCVIAGTTGSFQFTLEVPKDKTRMVNYSPTLDPQRDDFISILPAFLREDVEFGADNLPIFFWRLSSVMNKV